MECIYIPSLKSQSWALRFLGLFSFGFSADFGVLLPFTTSRQKLLSTMTNNLTDDVSTWVNPERDFTNRNIFKMDMDLTFRKKLHLPHWWCKTWCTECCSALCQNSAGLESGYVWAVNWCTICLRKRSFESIKVVMDRVWVVRVHCGFIGHWSAFLHSKLHAGKKKKFLVGQLLMVQMRKFMMQSKTKHHEQFEWHVHICIHAESHAPKTT